MKEAIRYFGTIGTASYLTLAKFAGAKSADALDFDNTATRLNNQISTDENIVDTVFTVINWVLVVTGAAAVLMLIIGGFRYITSAGSESQIEAAKTTMTSAIIGLVIVLLAFVIAATINNIILNPS